MIDYIMDYKEMIYMSDLYPYRDYIGYEKFNGEIVFY